MYSYNYSIPKITSLFPNSRISNIIADINKALVLKKYINPATKVLVGYYKYLDIFLRKEANKLAEY